MRFDSEQKIRYTTNSKLVENIIEDDCPEEVELSDVNISAREDRDKDDSQI